MPNDKIMPGSLEQDRLKGTVWEKFHDMLQNFQNLPENLFSTEEAKEAKKKLEDDMENLLEQMKEQYLRRNNMGGYLPMTSDEYQNLKQQFDTCLKDSRALPEELQQNETVHTLRNTLARGRNAMTAQPEDQLPSFAEAVSPLIPSTIRLVDSDIKTMGGALSSRLAVSYTDESGKIHKGFLTKSETEVRSMESQLNELAEKLGQKYPNSKKAIRHATMDINFQKAIIKSDEGQSLNMFLKYNQGVWMKGLEPNKKEKIFAELALEMKDILVHGLIAKRSGILPGSKIPQRNGAMSDVARLLGFPQLLAESRRVTIEENGKQISGVMMETADIDTVDNAALKSDSPFLKIYDDEFDSETTLRSLADLQILDFLCGNTDRHKSNFFTRFENSAADHPKIAGVQGIDNDTSFGVITDGTIRLAKADNLKIITPEMAKAIESLSEEDLGEVLDDYDLSDAEKNAAKTRLNTLKEYISNGKEHEQFELKEGQYGPTFTVPKGDIHIVKPNEWKSLTLDSLVTLGHDNENIFCQMQQEQQKVENLKLHEFYSTEKKVTYATQNADDALKEIRQTLEQEYQAVKKMKTLLEGKGKEHKGGQTPFTNLSGAVHFLDQQYKKLLKETGNLHTMNDDTIHKLDQFYQRLASNREQIANSASIYKNGHGIIQFSPSGRARMEVARKLENFMKPEKALSKQLYDQHKLAIHSASKERDQRSADADSAYAANTLGSLMENAIKRNMEKHSRSGETYALGIEALKAQKRLWNFSQSQAKPEALPKAQNKESAMNENGREQLSFDELVQDVPQVRKDVSADVNTILAFVNKQNSSARKAIQNRMANGDVQALPKSKTKQSILNEQTGLNKQEVRMNPKSMTPQEALRFLGMVFEQESKIAGKDKKKSAPVKQAARNL